MSTQSPRSGFVSAQRVRELRDVAKAGTPSPTKRPVLKSRAGVDPDMIFVGETPDFIYLVDSVGNVLIDDELRLVQPDDVTWSAEGKVQVRKKKEGADASTVETKKGPLLSDVVNVIAKDYAQSVKHSKKYLGYAPTVLSGGFQTRPVTVGNAKGLWAEGLFADYEEESEARLAKSIKIMRAEEKKRKNNPNTHLSPQKKKLHSEKFWRVVFLQQLQRKKKDITLENQARIRAATFAYHVQQNPDVSELHQVAPDWMRHGKLSEWDEYRFYQSHAPDGSPKSYPALASEHVKYFHDVPLTKKVLQADVRAREEGEQARMRERARLMAQEHAAAEMRAAQAAGKPSDFASVLDDKGARVDVRTGKKKEDTTTNDNNEDGQEVDPSSLLSATSFFQAGFSPKSHMLPLSAMAPASNNKQRPLSQDPNMLRQTSGIGGGNKTDFRHERRLSSVQRRFHESARAFPGHMVANMAAEDLIRMDSKLRDGSWSTDYQRSSSAKALLRRQTILRADAGGSGLLQGRVHPWRGLIHFGGSRGWNSSTKPGVNTFGDMQPAVKWERIKPAGAQQRPGRGSSETRAVEERVQEQRKNSGRGSLSSMTEGQVQGEGDGVDGGVDSLGLLGPPPPPERGGSRTSSQRERSLQDAASQKMTRPSTERPQGQGPLQPRASRRPDGTAFYKRVVNAAGEFGRDAMWNRNDKTTLEGRNLKIAFQSYAHEPGAADRLREVIYTRAKAKPRPPRGTAELGNEIVGGGAGLDAEDAFYGGGNVGAYEVESALAPAGGDVGMRSTADVDRGTLAAASSSEAGEGRPEKSDRSQASTLQRAADTEGLLEASLVEADESVEELQNQNENDEGGAGAADVRGKDSEKTEQETGSSRKSAPVVNKSRLSGVSRVSERGGASGKASTTSTVVLREHEDAAEELIYSSLKQHLAAAIAEDGADSDRAKAIASKLALMTVTKEGTGPTTLASLAPPSRSSGSRGTTGSSRRGRETQTGAGGATYSEKTSVAAGGQQEASGGGIGGNTPSAPEAPRRKSRKSVSRPSTSTQPLAASYITPPAEGTRDFSRTEPHEALPEPLQATTSEAESQKSAKSAAAASNASGVWNVNEDVGGASAVPFGGNFSFLHQSNKHVPRRSAVQQQAPSASRRSSGTTSSSVGAATPSGASSVKSAGGEGTNKASVPSIFVAAPPESAAEAAVDEVEADPDVEDEVNMLNNVSDQASSRSSRAPSTQLVKVQPLDSVSAMDELPQSQMDEVADEKAKASTATGVSRGSGVSGAPELEASTRTSAAQNVVGPRSSSIVSERAASAQVPAARPSTGLRIDARDGQPVTYNAWLLKYPWDDFEEAAQFWLHMEPVMPAPIATHAEVRESHIAAAAPQATTTGAVTGSGSEDENAGPGTSSSTRGRGRAGAGGEPLRDASQGTTSHDVYSRAASSVSQATTPAQAPTTLDASVPQEGSHRRTSKDKSSIDAALLQSGLLQKHQDPLPPGQNVKTATSALGSARTASAPTSAPPRPQTVIDQEAAVSDLFHSRLHAYSRMGYEQQAAEQAAGTPGAFGYAGAYVDFGDVQQRVEDADALRSDEMSERDRMNAMAARARNIMFPSRSASGKSGGSAKSITSAYSYSRGRGLLKADALMSAMDQQQARDSAPQMNPYAMQMTSGGYGSSAMGQQMLSGPSRGRDPRGRSPRDGAGGASRAGNAMSEFEAALFGGGSRDRLAASSRSQGRTTGGGTGYNDNGPMSPNQFMFLPEAGASSASSTGVLSNVEALQQQQQMLLFFAAQQQQMLLSAVQMAALVNNQEGHGQAASMPIVNSAAGASAFAAPELAGADEQNTLLTAQQNKQVQQAEEELRRQFQREMAVTEADQQEEPATAEAAAYSYSSSAGIADEATSNSRSTPKLQQEQESVIKPEEVVAVEKIPIKIERPGPAKSATSDLIPVVRELLPTRQSPAPCSDEVEGTPAAADADPLGGSTRSSTIAAPPQLGRVLSTVSVDRRTTGSGKSTALNQAEHAKQASHDCSKTGAGAAHIKEQASNEVREMLTTSPAVETGTAAGAASGSAVHHKFGLLTAPEEKSSTEEQRQQATDQPPVPGFGLSSQEKAKTPGTPGSILEPQRCDGPPRARTQVSSLRGGNRAGAGCTSSPGESAAPSGPSARNSTTPSFLRNQFDRSGELQVAAPARARSSSEVTSSAPAGLGRAGEYQPGAPDLGGVAAGKIGIGAPAAAAGGGAAAAPASATEGRKLDLLLTAGGRLSEARERVLARSPTQEKRLLQKADMMKNLWAPGAGDHHRAMEKNKK